MKDDAGTPDVTAATDAGAGEAAPPPAAEAAAAAPAPAQEGGLTEANLRFLLQIVLILLLVEAVAMPLIALWLSGTATLDWRWTVVRLLALEAFTFLFLNIVTGALRPLLALVFKESTIERFHNRSGLLGFVLAVAHGGMALYILGMEGYPRQYFLIGPVCLAVLAIVVGTALARGKITRLWWWIHQINFVLFAALLVHGWAIGFDVSQSALLQAWFGLYTIVVAAALLYHIIRGLRRPRAKTPTQDEAAA